MFKEIYNLLNAAEHFGVSEDIEVLKGKYAKMLYLSDLKKKKIRNKKFNK